MNNQFLGLLSKS